jgi:hypothetical protein
MLNSQIKFGSSGLAVLTFLVTATGAIALVSGLLALSAIGGKLAGPGLKYFWDAPGASAGEVVMAAPGVLARLGTAAFGIVYLTGLSIGFVSDIHLETRCGTLVALFPSCGRDRQYGFPGATTGAGRAGVRRLVYLSARIALLNSGPC